MLARVPESWIPPDHLLDLRARVRLRHTLSEQRGEWQQRIQAVLYHHGCPQRRQLMTADAHARRDGVRTALGSGALKSATTASNASTRRVEQCCFAVDSPAPRSCSLLGAGAVAQAAAPRSYKNCTAMNKVYPHGVGRAASAKDKTASGPPVTNFRVSRTVYVYNDGKTPRHTREHDLDRDNDGIACEKL
jgi:hypothetical protein